MSLHRRDVAARRLASRIAVVREAVGLAAYAVGDWTTAGVTREAFRFNSAMSAVPVPSNPADAAPDAVAGASRPDHPHPFTRL